MASMPDLSGFSTTSGVSGLSSLFSKSKKKAEETKPTVPQIPIERLVSSPRRTVGRGRRDTILTGADGLQ